MSQRTARARRRVVVALASVWIVVPLLLVLARWPSWWEWIAPEQTPMTWVQSVVLVLAATGSMLIAYLQPARPAPWWMLGAGLAALAFDERFAIHERVRDNVLAPRDIRLPFLPWIAPGDFLLVVAGLIGLALLPMVWRAIRVDPGARAALVVGIGLAVTAVGMDSIDPSTWNVSAERVEQTAEEVIELGSGLGLLAAITLRLLALLDRVGATPTTLSHEDDVADDRIVPR